MFQVPATPRVVSTFPVKTTAKTAAAMCAAAVSWWIVQQLQHQPSHQEEDSESDAGRRVTKNKTRTLASFWRVFEAPFSLS